MLEIYSWTGSSDSRGCGSEMLQIVYKWEAVLKVCILEVSGGGGTIPLGGLWGSWDLAHICSM